jgi:putative glutamine amidotransferase
VKQKIVIGITDCAKYPNYEKWILKEPGVEVIQLGYGRSNFNEIKKCDGILLTGGEDLHPRFYNHPEYLKDCQQDDMDEKRDEFEWKVLAYSQENKLPVLGICRGLQIANAFFGGTLIPDIPSTGKPDHSKVNGIDRYHPVQIEKSTLLNKIAGEDRGEVNSAHHQSAADVGRGLMVNAVSADGIVEGLERQHPEGKSFLLLVQWHPERMKDQGSPLVKNIKERFLESVRKASSIPASPQELGGRLEN